MEEELRQRLHIEPADKGGDKGDNTGGTAPKPPRQTFVVKKMLAVVALLLLISLVAGLVVHLFEYLGFVEKREKKAAYVV